MKTLIHTFIQNLSDKYIPNYSKQAPLLASSGGSFSASDFMLSATSGLSPLERARKSLAKNQQTAPPPTQPHRPPKQERPEKQHNNTENSEQQAVKPQTARKNSLTTKASRPAKRQPTIKSRRVKRPPVITATVTGLVLSAVVLLAATGLYGAYCFSRGTHGDVSVTASAAMYALAVFVGCLWSSAMVKRQSYAPPIIIGAAYLTVSLIISARLFGVADFKILMILEKLLLTAIAGFAGYALSLIPYLLNKATKHR